MGKLMDSAEIVQLSGPDAESFAQSQFSNDIAALPVESWQWSAWLDPQGRVRFLFALLHPQPGQLLAWLPRGDAKRMATELARFILRSRVKIEAMSGICLLETPYIGKTAQAMIASDGRLVD